MPGRCIGILGGSFNPAHEGHRHISLEALKRLELDEVWWMVSPQNPLKSRKGMAPLEERIATAQKIAAHPRIRITSIETQLGTRYTADTLTKLGKFFPMQNFVWLMGADNMVQMPHWKHWQRIFYSMPVAIISRPTYSLRALASIVASRFQHYRIRSQQYSTLVYKDPPAWVFLFIRGHSASATKIRAGYQRSDDNRN